MHLLDCDSSPIQSHCTLQACHWVVILCTKHRPNRRPMATGGRSSRVPSCHCRGSGRRQPLVQATYLRKLPFMAKHCKTS
ncbi:hypothetical protein BHE74_00003729 [Ensete ventricosum]|nr:hypothetical protein GW17_00047451 [Ensete ventricosum]RWW87445.1 hypothetical protein BHE74_00003729 [Ensete ventricosum]RZS06441.1 hypothetical protein BHM03_00037089 [Ensete ventricosum]